MEREATMLLLFALFIFNQYVNFGDRTSRPLAQDAIKLESLALDLRATVCIIIQQ